MDAGTITPLRSGKRKMMLVRAFLASNVASGCAFGGFGVSVLALREKYLASSGAVTMCISLVVLMLGILSPVAAAIISRAGIRATMLLGIILLCFGYLALAFAPTFIFVISAFALLIGPGVVFMGALPASVLAGGWYPEHRGRAVGIVNVPVFLAAVPLFGAPVIEIYGLRGFYLLLLGIHLLTLPLMLGIRNPPLVEVSAPAVNASVQSSSPVRDILRLPMFWMIALGIGLGASVSALTVPYIIPIAVEKGIAPQQAAVLLSVSAATAAIGAIPTGFLCDRLGGARTLALAAIGYAVCWSLLGWGNVMPALILAAVVLGFSGSSVWPATNVLLVKVFGVQALPRVLGLLGVFSIAFPFVLTPAAGVLRDSAGSFTPVSFVVFFLSLALGTLFFAISSKERGHVELE